MIAAVRPIGRVAPFTYNLTRSSMSAWLTALRLMRNGTRDAKLLCVGDSTTSGYGGTNRLTRCALDSYPAQLVTIMNAQGFGPAANGMAAGPSSLAVLEVNSAWTYPTGWSRGPWGFGSNTSARSNNTTNACTYAEDRTVADTFDVYWINGTGTPALALSATGGSTTNTSPSGSFAITKSTLTAGSAATTNVVSMSTPGGSGEANIVGVEPYLSTGPRKIRVGNVGAGTTTTTNWASSSTGISAVNAIRAYAPDLTIVDLGINDAGSSVATATVRANIQTVINVAAESGSVIFKTCVPSQPGVGAYAANEANYVADQINNLTGCAIIDYYNRATYAQNSAAGFMFDNLHPTTAGYLDVARFTYACLATIGG